ncbi:ABC transporter substrate-binding protein [Bifidobacterium avesanii]|uniref:Extracellular solute-binding protein n=1 Tax=Bifidobacterium avesanii TaxID=1798157 RepID=A0A7K3TF69_9BIFI|nr:sugar ABC transporter substrate-binding protein [Bifidobacterium avesanii]KAB8294451.1 ABC transporter substrate-binding protein [Bifidobacterium avesanii]NEG77718.1 extracellular solute-binding protein [Bifidobacterium avesanii]
MSAHNEHGSGIHPTDRHQSGTRRTITRKAVAVMAATAAVTMVLSGCGADSGSGRNEDGSVTINLNWWGGDERVKRTEEAVKAFEQSHPNIHVEMQYSDWSRYFDKLNTAIAGDNAPDVIQMDEASLATFASQGILLDLGEVSDVLDLSDIDQSLADSGKWEGKQYAMPISSTPFGLIINHDVLDKLGLTLPDTSTWTWDEFIDFAAQVRKKSNGEYYGINSTMGNGMSLHLWARQNNEALYTNGKVSISVDTMTSYLQMAYDWTHGDEIAGTTDQWAEQHSATLNQGALGTGKAAMGFSQTTQLPAYVAAAGTENMTLAPIPNLGKNPKYGYMKPGMHWVISASTKAPKEAAELVNWLVNSEEAGDILGSERGLPANKSILKKMSSSATGADKQSLDFPEQIADTIGDAPEPTPNGASKLNELIMRYEEDVAFGRMDARSAAEAFINDLSHSIETA